MGYTINKIQNEMTAAGSHWWDRGTMRWFKCRVSEQVYEGENGIYFVTSEKGPSEKRLYSVRKYDPATKDVDTVGDFNSMSRAQAHRLAAKSAGPAATVTAEVYHGPTAAEQLALDVNRNGGETNAVQMAYMIRLAKAHQKGMEDYCNGTVQLYGEDEELTPAFAKLRKKIVDLAKGNGCAGVHFQGDPRGCTVKLILKNGETNDWGKDGWCVPTGE